MKSRHLKVNDSSHIHNFPEQTLLAWPKDACAHVITHKHRHGIFAHTHRVCVGQIKLYRIQQIIDLGGHNKCMANDLLSRCKMQWWKTPWWNLPYLIIYIFMRRCELRTCNSINQYPRKSVLEGCSTMHRVFSKVIPFHWLVRGIMQLDKNP